MSDQLTRPRGTRHRLYGARKVKTHLYLSPGARDLLRRLAEHRGLSPSEACERLIRHAASSPLAAFAVQSPEAESTSTSTALIDTLFSES